MDNVKVPMVEVEQLETDLDCISEKSLGFESDFLPNLIRFKFQKKTSPENNS